MLMRDQMYFRVKLSTNYHLKQLSLKHWIKLWYIDLKDFCRWPDEPFEEMDSTLAVQQYIQQLIKKDPSNIEAILTMPESQDEGVWKYEHLR